MQQLLTGLRAAAEPTRLRLLALCDHAELAVNELTQILGQSQPRVSRHLKLLCEAGLLERHREGSWVYYRLAESGTCATLARVIVDQVPEDDAVLGRDLERLEQIKQARVRAAAQYFQDNAEQWDEIRSLHAEEGRVEAAIRARIRACGAQDVLDIGTGTGRILEVLAADIRRGVGIDLSHDMLRLARARFQADPLRHCQARHGDMYALPLESGSFDAAVLYQVLHYAEEPRSALREAVRVLRPGGTLIVVDFERHEEEHLRSEHQHRWLGFEPDEVAGWCRSAGLVLQPAERLEGGPLTVHLWEGSRPAVAAANDEAADGAAQQKEAVS